MNKQFVDVTSVSYSDGTVRPLLIRWPDGRTFEITRTMHVAAPAANEYEGICYTGAWHSKMPFTVSGTNMEEAIPVSEDDVYVRNIDRA